MKRLLIRLCVGRDGTSAIEFALIAPVLCLLLVGVIDFGRGAWCQLQVANAAAAGAAYASVNGWNATADQIVSAVTNATGLGSIAASPAPAWSCGCPSVSAGITAIQCGSVCPDSSNPAHYVTVNATATYALLLPYPGIGSSLVLSATSFSRLYP